MRKLTLKEIEKFSSRKGARKIAVENFLATMEPGYVVAAMNYRADARAYRWGRATCKAIEGGIKMALNTEVK